jgi:phosphoesterase RecJ-like protein
MTSMEELLAVPPHRRAPLEELLRLLEEADDIALTTHVNADGDGAGSEAALAGWLLEQGKTVAVANPTAFPDPFRYMLDDQVELTEAGAPMDRRVRNADLLVVLDTGAPSRIGRVARLVRDDAVAVLDHHPPHDKGIPGPGLRDPTACATGELVFDLFTLAGVERWSRSMVQGLYAAIETDTGSFRFSNTTPRTHAMAAELIRRGVDTEDVYRRLHATVSMEQVEMLRLALEGLETDGELPITWITIPRTVTHGMEATTDDLDGIVQYARNVEGTEVALLFRQTRDGSTKISLRSNGEVDVNAIAREFGGGGHVKAAGALVSGAVDGVRTRVLDAVRAAVREELAREAGT